MVYQLPRISKVRVGLQSGIEKDNKHLGGILWHYHFQYSSVSTAQSTKGIMISLTLQRRWFPSNLPIWRCKEDTLSTPCALTKSSRIFLSTTDSNDENAIFDHSHSKSTANSCAAVNFFHHIWFRFKFKYDFVPGVSRIITTFFFFFFVHAKGRGMVCSMVQRKFGLHWGFIEETYMTMPRRAVTQKARTPVPACTQSTTTGGIYNQYRGTEDYIARVLAL